MKLSYLWRRPPGHPIHPPLTDATIGTYTFGAVAGLAEVTGITQNEGAYGLHPDGDVLSLVSEPAERAVSPVPHAEKEQAEGG
jgi:hypothetical protein